MIKIDAKRISRPKTHRRVVGRRSGEIHAIAVVIVALMIILNACTEPFTLVGFLDGEGEAEVLGRVIVEEGFEAPPGTIANALGLNSYADAGTSAQVLSWSGRNVLALSDVSGSGYVYAHQMIVPFVESRATIEYEVAQASGQMMCYLELWDQGHVPIVDMHVDDSGALFYTDHLGVDHLAATMTVEQLYHFRFEVNLATQRYELYLDDSLLLSNIAFRNPANDLVFVEFRTSVSDFGSVLVLDNLRIISHD